MNLLIYQWTSYYQHDLYDICKDMNIDFKFFEWKFKDKNHDDMFEKWFEENVDLKQYDALLSVNYYPMLSKMCSKQGCKYIAWCYDNPLNVDHIEDTLHNSINYVFLFDRIQYNTYKKMGFDTVYYFPLGINEKRYGNLKITKEDIDNYGADVAFVGSLYNSVFYQLLNPLNDHTRGYINSLLDMQSQIYGYFILENAISDKLVNDINAQYREKEPNTKLVINKKALLFAMASEITRRDRLILLNLSAKKYDTRLYSYDDHEVIQNVKQCGSLDYINEMPHMFACTKVNLNPSLRIIQSGIPQRALDIMGAGGFLLSNYQEELAEYYEDGKDMVLYESIGDALDKIDFYLKHDELRINIAKNGREKTLKEHTMQQCFSEIIKMVMG